MKINEGDLIFVGDIVAAKAAATIELRGGADTFIWRWHSNFAEHNAVPFTHENAAIDDLTFQKNEGIIQLIFKRGPVQHWEAILTGDVKTAFSNPNYFLDIWNNTAFSNQRNFLDIGPITGADMFRGKW